MSVQHQEIVTAVLKSVEDHLSAEEHPSIDDGADLAHFIHVHRAPIHGNFVTIHEIQHSTQ